ncbi:MAG: inositol monophosphatase [Gammaproteobacteria bacterium RIFCSPHIGHO2_12_FULL_42_13]|nr:MAG: inositol monophosphatase [Gammaproteobacteria bacterium RIFCSPHIGHO2_12_FULL_42_13]
MLHPFLNIAIQAARAAAKVVVRYVDQIDKVVISEKSAHDFVTQVDQQSEAIIIETIQHVYPNHAILAEESGELSGHSEYTWIIDPLDGTRNFVHGFPHFSISIAVLKNNQPEIGLVYDPIRQELFTASQGQGAYANNRRMRVSTAKKLDNTLIGTGFPFRNRDKTEACFDFIKKIFSQCGDIRRTGSAALDLAYVAAGRLDAFWEMGLGPWDIAAGAILIKEAGGVITDFQGGDAYLKTGNVACGNIKIHQVLLSEITDARL